MLDVADGEEKEESQSQSVEALTAYINDMRKTSLLTVERERELIKLAQAGNTAARNKLVQSNLRLVVKIARKFQHRGVELEDLIAEGNFGLFRAIELFKPEMGFRFTTYATPWIDQHIRRAINITGRAIRLPVHRATLTRKVQALIHNQKRVQPAVDLQQVADQLDLPLSKVYEVLNAAQHPTSLDCVHVDGENEFDPLINILEDESAITCDSYVVDAQTKAVVAHLIESLDEVDQLLIKMRYGFDLAEDATLEQVAERVGVTRERIRQRQKAAIRDMRKRLHSLGIKQSDLLE